MAELDSDCNREIASPVAWPPGAGGVACAVSRPDRSACRAAA
ncbi:hypothetical protein N1F89_14340 [Aquibium sp. A9E412]|nr:hypothetical protein [Aquibium sp. A9E412]MDN2567399.1 hypothetical protein [Aquibium sp. A9E412]